MKEVLIFVIIAIVAYGVFAFVGWQPNPYYWDGFWRFALVIVTLIGYLTYRDFYKSPY